MGSIFKNRTVGFYIGLLATALALVTAVLYTVLNIMDNQFNALVLILLLIGTAIGIASIFLEYRFIPMIEGLILAASFGVYIESSFVNAFNTMIGQAFHNVDFFVLLCVMFSMIVLMSAVSNFMPQRKP